MQGNKRYQLQTTKNQHIVPRCYLERWCNNDGRIHAFKLEGGHTSTPHPKSAATREHIYDTLETLNKADPENYQIFEKTLGRIEDEIPSVFESILSNARRAHSAILIPTECTQISEEVAGKIIRLSVVQFLRDARQRDHARLGWNDWLQQVWDITVPMFFEADDEPGVCFESISEQFLTEWLLEYLKDRLLRFSKVIKNKTLVIGLNKTEKRLLTSDSPVHWTGYYIDASENWDGINSRSSRMVYPLAPDACVIFYDSKFYTEQRPYHRCVRVLSHQEVREFNQFTTLQSDKQIFACDGDFSHAELALNEQIISGAKWPKRTSSQVPEDLVALVKLAGCARTYTKSEWKAFIQFDGRTNVAKYQAIREQLLHAFDSPLTE